MSMTFLDLRTEFAARGFDYENATRANRWINQAYLALCECWTWPFTEATITGPAPLTISDVRQILSVSDTTNQCVLVGVDRRDIVDVDPAMTSTGSPESWYLEDSVLKVYPASTTASLAVRYAKVPAELVNDTDVPIIPSRFQDLIIDGACIRGYKDSDELATAQTLQGFYDRGVNEMLNSLSYRNDSNPEMIRSTNVFYS